MSWSSDKVWIGIFGVGPPKTTRGISLAQLLPDWTTTTNSADSGPIGRRSGVRAVDDAHCLAEVCLPEARFVE
jgi:hypothetical protein